jgi:putative DNA primase/helicase
LRALGYSLTAETRERAIFVCYGTGLNGKSTLLAAVHGSIPEYAVVINSDSLMATKFPSNNAQADLADLFGARFVRTSECESNSVLSQARLKSMTQGYGGHIRACKKYQNPFDFQETHKLWIDTNSRPKIHDVDDRATFDRLHAIPFLVVIPEKEKDEELGRKLEEERAGIFAQLVWSARDWYCHGLGKPAEVAASTDEWREENDNLSQFIRECCELGKFFSERASRLYDIYKMYCERNKEYIQKNKEFSAGLQKRGYERSEDNKGRRYHGLKLKEHPLADPDEDDNDKVPF